LGVFLDSHCGAAGRIGCEKRTSKAISVLGAFSREPVDPLMAGVPSVQHCASLGALLDSNCAANGRIRREKRTSKAISVRD
jgi:hypothetical protein